MSHKYPYRGSTSDTDLRPEAGHYNSANRRHISPDLELYRPSQESFTSFYPPSSSSRSSTPAQWAQDGALSILSSCGLEPSDLALLAKLPEDVLTVESLPHVLKQIKGKRETVSSSSPSTLSPSTSFSYRQAPLSSSRVWDQLHSQPIQYPLNHVAPDSLPSEQDRWRNSRTSRSVRSDPTPSSSSRYTVDFHNQTGPSDYGKTGRGAGAFSSQELSFSSTGQGRSSHPTGFSEPRSAPPPELHHPKPWVGHNQSQTSSTRNSSWQTAATSMPSEKEVLDFHGTCPTVFPFSCSLCDITVLSEKVWLQHINGTQHAEGQLRLLQQFPNWDCRLESHSRAKNQMEKKKYENKTSHSPQTATKSHKPKPETKSEKKTSEKGKVVCVKFPPQTVDETYLRKLTEPFGKIVQILMFPSLAFLELASTDQAKELVKFHVNYPPTVNGEQIEFSISNTFSFLQSAQVVSFSPVPKGEDGQSDLICIVKRFGPPLYSLFLPSTAFIEMKNTFDAQKLVDYYSSNTLRINNTCIKVSFSGEYKTLIRVPSAKKYEEEKVLSKRTRSSSPEKESKRRRSSSKDRVQERRKSSTDGRARSREKLSKERRSRSRDKQISSNRDRKARSRSKDKSREKSNKESKTRSRSREKSSRTRSRSREKSNIDSKTRSREKSSNGSKEKSLEREKPETESRTEDEHPPHADTQQTEAQVVLSGEDSDIEGMEVIGEGDEENVKNLNDPQGEEEEAAAEKTDSPEEGKEVEEEAENEEEQEIVCAMKKPEENSETIKETEEAAETRLEDDKESDFPVDLKSCITLDELENDQSDNQGEDTTGEAESLCSRVVYFRDLPVSNYTDNEFIKLVKDFGKAVRYLLVRQNQEGFIEMSSSSEAQRAAQELSQKPFTFSGSQLFVNTLHEYESLKNGKVIQLDSDQEERSESQSSHVMRSEHQSKSKTPDREKIFKRFEGTKESLKKIPDEGSGSKPSAVEESASEMAGEQESSDDKKFPESSSGSLSPEEAITKNISEKAKTRKPDKGSSRKAEEEPVSDETEEQHSAAKDELLPKTCQGKDTRKELRVDGEETQTQTEEEGLTKADIAEGDEKFSEGQRVCSAEETLKPAGECPDPTKPQTEQKPEKHTVKVEQGAGPVGGTAEPDEPLKPVGTEFVRPVVGYFCNLCQLIYADEDEAKLQHCSSQTHYRKYQEKLGKDPWTS